MGADKDVLTTGDVARICRVTIRTVIKWFDQGRLEGYRLPGSGDRRFPRRAVERFLIENDLPLELLEGPSEPSVPEETPSRRVLVVDDDQDVREMMSRYLRTLGPDVVVDTAASGWEAGLKTASTRPHLLLLDYRLGDTTGEHVLDTIRAHEGLDPQPAIVLMSAHLTPEEADAILARGAQAFLPKPFDLERLRDTVLHHLGAPR